MSWVRSNDSKIFSNLTTFTSSRSLESLASILVEVLDR